MKQPDEYLGNDIGGIVYYKAYHAVKMAQQDARAAGVGATIMRALDIVTNEPLGYKTEREHEVLENFVARLSLKIHALLPKKETAEDEM